MTLSEEMGHMIVSAKASHQALIHAYMDERRQQVCMFVDSNWVPEFMAALLVKTNIIRQVSSAPSDALKGQLLTEYTEDAAAAIAQRRVALLRVLDDTERMLDSAVAAHYDDILMVNASLTAHLRSAAKIGHTREELLKALHLRPEQIIPLDRIDRTLTEVVRFKGNIEDAASKAGEIHALLDSLNHQEP
ncbi:MAG TPA: hypothetical protein VGL38_05995 [bacterium]